MSVSALASAAVLATAVFFAATVRVRADDPVSSSVRFNREIARILQRRCLACHMEGGLSVPLASYRDVRDWSRAIREEIVEQRMPPASAAAGYGRFENELGLTFRETTTLLSWLDGGMPRGDEKDLPPPLDLSAFESDPHADFSLTLPEQAIPALEELVVRRVTVATNLPGDRLVSRLAVRPGVRSVIRGAFVYAGADEQSWIGAWLPWQHTVAAPPGRGFRLSKGSAVTLVVYYRGGDEPVTDRSTVDFYFANSGATPIDTLQVEDAGADVVIPAETTVWALNPRPLDTTRSLELRATRPDGSIEVLLWVPTVRAEWPDALLLQEPITLPAKTRLTLSTQNDGPQHGAVSPPQRARVGLSTWRSTPR